MSLALVVAVRKLQLYFHTHPIIVMTDQPIKQVMRKPEALGRIVRWAIELSEFDIRFKPRGTIKAQALMDFIIEGTRGAEDTSAGDPSDAAEDLPATSGK